MACNAREGGIVLKERGLSKDRSYKYCIYLGSFDVSVTTSFYYFRVLHTTCWHFLAQPFARSVTVARSSTRHLTREETLIVLPLL